ncbi:hypothetical protein AB0K18_14235 [Nonomuraea sp. NPDC049421]|uniref:hypothetical protein n=1 Tax=Nonomuraea sp. NPDC049421 TaxID=3155275 RepID=UPI0034239EA7
MADHDRDAGSRGGEEAPRDPSPVQPALKYGEQADQAYAEIPPTQPVDWETPRSGGRRGSRVLIGAGLVGLLAGALIGGVSVAAVNDAGHDHGRFDVWYDMPRPDRFRVHAVPDVSCWERENEVRCSAPSPPRVPRPPRPDDAPAAPVAPAYDD